MRSIQKFSLGIVAAASISACGGATIEVPNPTLSDIQAKVFTPTCAISGCHDAGAEGGLDLRDGQAFTSLVGVASDPSRSTLPRVTPGDASQSFLINKLERPAGGEGALMPQGTPEPLDAAIIEAIKTWINNGAENN